MLILETTFDYEGYPDYYSGHGHAFAPDNPVACIRFGFPVTYQESVGEIIEMVLEDINSYMCPFDVINQELFESYEDEIRAITDEMLEASIRRELPEGTKDADNFFSGVDEEIIEGLIEEDVELPVLIGYIHIYVQE